MDDALKRFWKLRRMAVTFGLTAVVAPTAGMVITAIWVRHSLSEMELPAGDPRVASAPMGEVLIPALIGLGVAVVALALCLACILRALRERRKLQSRIHS